MIRPPWDLARIRKAGASTKGDSASGASGEGGEGEAVAARIAHQTRRALRALWLERIVRCAWPLYAVIVIFMGLALSGGFEAMPRWGHMLTLILFGVAALGAAWWGARAFRMPTEAEARAELEIDQIDRPLASLSDQQATGREDPGAQAVWAAHQRRMAEQAGRLKARAAELRLSRQDPMALRLVALGVLAFGLLAGAGTGSDRLVSAFDPGAAPAGAAEIAPSIEAWATPPSYAGGQMIYLTEREGQEIRLPQGSRIALRVYNAPDTPSLSQSIAADPSAPAPSGDPTEAASGRDGARDGALTPFGEGAWDLQLTADQSGELRVETDGVSAGWRFVVAADAPPSIAFDDGQGPAVGQADTGAMRLSYEASDDHGVTNAWAVIALDRQALGWQEGMLPPPPGLEDPIEIELPLPLTGGSETVRDSLIEDLTAHPWAGLPVTITLHAEDALGQSAAAGPRPEILPGRPFYDPMARALAEQRRTLAWSLSNAPGASQRIKAVTAYPDDYFDALAGPYLLIRAALRRLDYAMADGRVAEVSGEVMEMLWTAALMLEEGDLNSAAERLRRAKERLSDALERGADEQEVARLMDELRQAMSDYLNELARQAMENMQAGDQPQGQQGQQMTGRDLQEMLDEIERMAQEDPETAQQMLERLAQMLQNLQMQAQQGGQSGQGEQSLDQLNDMLREQQDLADRSFEEMQRRQGGGDPGQQGQPGQPGGQGGQEFGGQGGADQQVPGQGGRRQGPMAGAAQEQEALRQLLEQLRDGLPGGLSPEAEQALRDADRAMNDARGALEGDQPGEALDDQVEAMESLREGARQLGDALRQQAREGQGDRAGQADPNAQDEGRDPLGRPTANRGSLEGGDTEVPGQEALKRARELLDEIRRRSGERNRPELELEYLRRLLDRF